MACHAATHKISGCRQHILLVCPLKVSQSWSHMSTRTTNGNYLKDFCQSVEKQQREGKNEEENIAAIAKLFALHASTMIFRRSHEVSLK